MLGDAGADTDPGAEGWGPLADGPAGRVLYAGSDPAVLHPLLDEHFTPHAMDIVGRGPLDATFRALHSGRVAVYDLAYGTDVVTSPGRPPDRYVIRIGHEGRAALDVEGRATPFSPSIVSPGMAVTARWDADTSARFLCVPRSVMDKAVRTRLGESPAGPVVFRAPIDTRLPDARAWLALARQFARMTGSGLLARSPQATAHYEQVLIHALLTAQPHSLARPLAEQPPRAAGPSVLRRATAYCEENVAEPISVGDIATAARVSVRTLQAEFRRRLGMGPLRYLRELRLAGAHADLRAVADGRAQGTVAEIANRWGFPQRRHFTTMYTRTYGRLPSETLRLDAPPANR
ncbi:AraC family transcriptional regulator [Yinghuangia soli]|uniref:AraC family transcriptional regulator n=1 Tax=Yinghuangia soli TaxID=2908204 RepID=A0AA41QA38_9ACTN|nr:AraC family transcriptional regulator [Yinghuangia soli]MCF2534011.1 AraC family transcriptional regulator [Yinghuangia soli]